MSEPLPCPFCGEVPGVYLYGHDETDEQTEVRCRNSECLVNPETRADTEAEAVGRWNVRYVPVASAEREALAAIYDSEVREYEERLKLGAYHVWSERRDRAKATAAALRWMPTGGTIGQLLREWRPGILPNGVIGEQRWSPEEVWHRALMVPSNSTIADLAAEAERAVEFDLSTIGLDPEGRSMPDSCTPTPHQGTPDA